MTVLTTLAGSHAHGLNTETSDYDYISIEIATLSSTLGLDSHQDVRVERNKPNGVRSEANDVEHTIYELKHFCKLASQGNPNMLVPLFCADQHVVGSNECGQELRAIKNSFLSKSAVRRHLGYLDAQRARMVGNGPHQSRKPNRPEIIEKHGYDTKYAAHALRLGYQGRDLGLFGGLFLPIEGQDLKTLLAIRNGEVPEQDALAMIDEVRSELERMINANNINLPDRPNMYSINNFLIHWQLELG